MSILAHSSTPLLDPASLVSLQIRLEYDLDAEGRLISRPGSTEQALCVVYRYAGGGRIYFQHDLPLMIQRNLPEIDPVLAFTEPARLDDLLGKPLQATREVFQSSLFTHCPVPEEYPLVERDGEAFVIRAGRTGALLNDLGGDPSRQIAIAWSVRQDDLAAEIAVETDLAFRRHGFARQVAAAWAASQMKQHRAAFYSHKVSNLASLALRQSLGAVLFADCMAWESTG